MCGKKKINLSFVNHMIDRREKLRIVNVRQAVNIVGVQVLPVIR